VIVSHDRALLDALTHATVRLEHGHARHWPLPYSAAREAWLAAEASLRAKREELSRKLHAATHSLDQGRRKQQAANRRRSAGNRMKSPKDSDARTLAQTRRAEKAERSLADANGRQQRTVEVLGDRRARLDLPPDPPPPLFLRYQPCPKRWRSRSRSPG